MQPLFLSWLFDKRWLFGLRNPCYEFLLVVPIIADLVTFAMMLYEHSLAKTDTDPYFIILTLAYLLQGALCLLMLVRIYTRAEEKSKVVRENYEAIKEFTHSFEAKKGVWSWIGASLIAINITQLVFNNLYIKACTQYGCYTNWTRLYMDIVTWSYLGAVFVLFLLFKAGFLVLAWNNPQRYLQYKSII